MLRITCTVAAVTALAAFAGSAEPGQPPAQQRGWSVDSAPVLTIGESLTDSSEMFAVVGGATMLPDGTMIVADRGEHALLVFGADGRRLRAFGRRGSGPGEIGSVSSMHRCGDTLVVQDLANGYRVSVFALNGAYVRSFRFASPDRGQTPYRTTCGSTGIFAHFGWEKSADMRGGTFRAKVPFWITGADSTIRAVIGSLPGSERFGKVVDGRVAGTRPLPLGKQPVIAAGRDRVYVGLGDRYEIAVYDLAGRPRGTISKPGVDLRTTPADLERAKAHDMGDTWKGWPRHELEADYKAMTIPATLPAYSAMVVDAEGLVWVRDYPRAGTTSVRWTIFSADGAQRGELPLPEHLTVYEIGRDYVLGRYTDPDESVPTVRKYRLRRPAL